MKGSGDIWQELGTVRRSKKATEKGTLYDFVEVVKNKVWDL
jgi:hypothetical protein